MTFSGKNASKYRYFHVKIVQNITNMLIDAQKCAFICYLHPTMTCYND